MNILWILIPLAFCLSGLFLILFLKSVHSGQFDKLDQDAAIPLQDPEKKA